VDKKRNYIIKYYIILFLLLLYIYPSDGISGNLTQDSTITIKSEMPSLAEIDRRLNNPLTSLWSLVFQENLILNTGDLVDGTEIANNFFFQPALPVPIGKRHEYLFFARPVFPIVTYPVITDGSRSSEHKTGLGDIQLFSVIGPSREDGWVWGGGATFIFPTATDDILGQGKFQAGPAALLFHMGNPWTLGILGQHWWSVTGDENRPETNHTDIQYVARHQLPNAWSIGMGPTISINWEAEKGNRLTLPIGLGITKTIRIGKTPVKIRIEPQYSIIKPDDYGTEWNIRLQIAPVIKSPFM
jgi:hypothetical protein